MLKLNWKKKKNTKKPLTLSSELDFQNQNAVFVVDITNPSDNNLRKKPTKIIDFDPKRSYALTRDRMPTGRRSTL